MSAKIFEVPAQHKDVKIEQIVSHSHTAPASGWYDQDQHEWVIVLKGEAQLLFEDGQAIDIVEYCLI